MYKPLKGDNGFTLIELSIVLVIIGLILGGVLVGQDLIKSSQIRSVITEQRNYITAIDTFKLKYNCLPGDCANASDFFPSAPDGDGNKYIGAISQGTGGPTSGSNIVPGQPHPLTSRERWYAWNHLGEAGLVSGKYTGASGAGHPILDDVRGENIPVSKFPGAGWCFDQASFGWRFALDFSNSLLIATSISDTTYCSAAIFTPAEAFAIDQKVDDGMPAKGKVVSMTSTDCTTAHTTVDDYDATYTTPGRTDVVCSLIFRNAF